MITTKLIPLLFVLCLAIALPAEAKEINKTQAMAVAHAFSTTNLDRIPVADDPVYTALTSDAALRSDGGRALFYAYNLKGGGFVIVSADTRAHPVLAYSAEGEFSANEMPASMQVWLKNYEREIAHAIAQTSSPEDGAQKEWDALSSRLPRTASNEVRLQTVNWDQNDPYNAICPKDGRSTTQAGCVATAMGIVMKYHRWPNRGQGSIKYSTKTRNISVSANFNAEYKWDNMRDTYNRSNGNGWTQQQAEAVATLLFHCGAAVEMDYLVNGSGATEWEVVRALTENFGYDKSLCLAYRDLYSVAEWDSLMQKEINEGRPILYGGITGYSVDDDEGHQLVVDGYSLGIVNIQAEDPFYYYHINWGWNGSNNGYFLLSALSPNSSHKGYNLEQDAIIGVRKDNAGTVRHEMFFVKSDAAVSPSPPTGLFADVDSIYPGKPFNINTTYIADYGMRDFKGSWGFFVTGADGQRKDSLEVSDYDLKSGYGVKLSSDEPYVVNEIEEGDRVRLFYRSEGHEWRLVRGFADACIEIPLGVRIGTGAEKIVRPTNIVVAADNGYIAVRSASEPIREIAVYSISGQLMHHERMAERSLSALIPAQTFAHSIYIVKVTAAGGTYTCKIIL
ncbi:MAG: thiol protease/hemagglutinin PrtT [Tannerellaceae bacterium]|jgi:hypothetical protein|nr:thiol protease/hemagglutinin PrtT [Tannerellaceae bacterium]